MRLKLLRLVASKGRRGVLGSSIARLPILLDKQDMFFDILFASDLWFYLTK